MARTENPGRVGVSLTRAEIHAVLEAVGQMTSGNARSFDEWRQQTSGSKREWNALLRGEAALLAAIEQIP